MNVSANKTIRIFYYFAYSQVLCGFLQTAQTWTEAGICNASCAVALGSMFVCLCVCFTGNLCDCMSFTLQ